MPVRTNKNKNHPDKYDIKIYRKGDNPNRSSKPVLQKQSISCEKKNLITQLVYLTDNPKNKFFKNFHLKEVKKPDQEYWQLKNSEAEGYDCYIGIGWNSKHTSNN